MLNLVSFKLCHDLTDVTLAMDDDGQAKAHPHENMQKLESEIQIQRKQT